MVPHRAGEDSGASHGAFVAFVCRACGFTEWYATNPESIPADVLYGTEEVAPSAPYR